MAIPYREQLWRHISGWKASGVDFVPRAAPPAAQMLNRTESKLPAKPVNTRTPLQLLANEFESCGKCPELAATRLCTVPGNGPENANLFVLADAPQKEDTERRGLFHGSTGVTLNTLLIEMGFHTGEVYFSTAIRCRPPGNRQPKPQETANCREYLVRELELAKPKFILCLGAAASQSLLERTDSIVELRGQLLDYRGIPTVCTYHPSYFADRPQATKEVHDDLGRLLKAMGRKPE